MTKLEQAQALRERKDIHFNCAQSVLVTFAREAGLTEEAAFALGGPFGGGMHKGSVCGALTGGLMALGLMGVPQEKISQMMDDFAREHGTMDCAELLKRVQRGEIEKSVLCDGLVGQVVARVEQLRKEQEQ